MKCSTMLIGPCTPIRLAQSLNPLSKPKLLLPCKTAIHIFLLARKRILDTSPDTCIIMKTRTGRLFQGEAVSRSAIAFTRLVWEKKRRLLPTPRGIFSGFVNPFPAGHRTLDRYVYKFGWVLAHRIASQND